MRYKAIEESCETGIVYPGKEKTEVSFQNKLQMFVYSIDNCEQLHRVSGLKLEQKGFGPDIRKCFMNIKTVKPAIKGNCGDK